MDKFVPIGKQSKKKQKEAVVSFLKSLLLRCSLFFSFFLL